MKPHESGDKLVYRGSHQDLDGAIVTDLIYFVSTGRYTVILTDSDGKSHALINVRHESLQPYGHLTVVK